MCMHWQKGDCYRGDNCTYAHGHEELKSRSQAEACYKTRSCTYFQEKGTCPKGITCTFAHGEKDLRSPTETQVPLPVKRSGFYASKLCEYYPKTDCQNGDDCPFAHGLHEIRVAAVRSFEPADFDLNDTSGQPGQRYLPVKENDVLIRKPHPEDVGGWVQVSKERGSTGWVPEWTLPADPACEGITGDDVLKELEEYIDAQGGSEADISEGQLRIFTRQSRGPRLFMAGNPMSFCKDCVTTLTLFSKKDEPGTFIRRKIAGKAPPGISSQGSEMLTAKSEVSSQKSVQESSPKPAKLPLDKESIMKLTAEQLWELSDLTNNEIARRFR
mmetsp:Transcript_41807/g.63181  ORF Transcript_41807/g.63181 Transcript_41807/m.63181 type:complete len:328 (-) Transcript_41807:43-1026(-)